MTFPWYIARNEETTNRDTKDDKSFVDTSYTIFLFTKVAYKARAARAMIPAAPAPTLAAAPVYEAG